MSTRKKLSVFFRVLVQKRTKGQRWLAFLVLLAFLLGFVLLVGRNCAPNADRGSQRRDTIPFKPNGSGGIGMSVAAKKLGQIARKWPRFPLWPFPLASRNLKRSSPQGFRFGSSRRRHVASRERGTCPPENSLSNILCLSLNEAFRAEPPASRQTSQLCSSIPVR